MPGLWFESSMYVGDMAFRFRLRIPSPAVSGAGNHCREYCQSSLMLLAVSHTTAVMVPLSRNPHCSSPRCLVLLTLSDSFAHASPIMFDSQGLVLFSMVKLESQELNG